MAIENLLKQVQQYIENKDNIELIKRAYEFSAKKHSNQFRKSGQPYIVHPVEVAEILATYQTGPNIIAAGLLHDVIEDCEVTKSEILENFNEEIAELVESVSKLRRLPEVEDAEEFKAANHRKLIVAMAKDVRAIIIKLADRLHNMRTIEYLSAEKKIQISKETLAIYTPLAHRLGMGLIKAELEDLALSYIEPEKYKTIKQLVSEKVNDSENALTKIQDDISEMLTQNKIGHSINGRIKNIYSIYKKVYLNHKNFEQIYDIQALRIITDSINRCYEVLGIVHSKYRPIPGRFKDYIAMPKPNMYQSLHTTIIDAKGTIFEIQVRTKKMDMVASNGVAAHWHYKENNNYNYKQIQKEIEDKLHWFRELIMYTDELEHSSYKEYVTSLQKDIFQANVYVLTPKGRVIDLPAEATPLDFAYKIHSDVGDRAIGAIINKVIAPLNTILKTGDVVEIKTSKTSQGPFEDWLKIVKSTSARHAIKKGLQRKNNQIMTTSDYINKGKEMLYDELQQSKLNSKSVTAIISEKNFLKSFKCEELEQLFERLGTNNLKIGPVIQKIKLKITNENQADAHVEAILKRKKVVTNNSRSSITISGVSNLRYTIAQCCRPIPGDQIVGYISNAGAGIKIHCANCNNLESSKGRLIEVNWNANAASTFASKIFIEASQRPQLLVDIMGVLSAHSSLITNFENKRNKHNLNTVMKITLRVTDKSALENIIVNLKKIIGVLNVSRDDK